MMKYRMKLSTEDNFWDKVLFTTDCWKWLASKTKTGYGRFRSGKECIPSHRFSFELYKGKVPEGLEINHICNNTSCVNPSHLEAITHQENCLKGDVGNNNQNSRKTHCQKGHPITGDNLYMLPDGRRQCVICKREWRRIQYQKDKKRGTT